MDLQQFYNEYLNKKFNRELLSAQKIGGFEYALHEDDGAELFFADQNEVTQFFREKAREFFCSSRQFFKVYDLAGGGP